jgi:hypothetical protein
MQPKWRHIDALSGFLARNPPSTDESLWPRPQHDIFLSGESGFAHFLHGLSWWLIAIQRKPSGSQDFSVLKAAIEDTRWVIRQLISEVAVAEVADLPELNSQEIFRVPVDLILIPEDQLCACYSTEILFKCIDHME